MTLGSLTLACELCCYLRFFIEKTATRIMPLQKLSGSLKTRPNPTENNVLKIIFVTC